MGVACSRPDQSCLIIQDCDHTIETGYKQRGDSSSTPQSSPSCHSCLSPREVASGSGGSLTYAAVSTQNRTFRHRMEDEWVVIPRFHSHNDDSTDVSSFFAVYDGHGGGFCSQYAKEHLHHRLRQMIEATSSHSDDPLHSDRDIESCFVQAFAQVDRELTTFDEAGSSGSTAVTCLVRRVGGCTRVHVANVGDSRAIYFSNGVTTRLSADHKPTDESECRRIRALNGLIINKRVAGFVSVTRALGQADEKRFISSVPHVVSVEVESPDAFLVLVSDGVSDVFSDEEITEFIHERLSWDQSPLEIASQLVAEARQWGATDNMTGVLVCLGGSN